MKAKRRIVLGFALAGFGVAWLLFAHIEATNYVPMPHAWAAVVLCPASLILVVLFDLNPHSAEMTAAWVLIAVLNAGIYAIVGSLISRLFLGQNRAAGDSESAER